MIGIALEGGGVRGSYQAGVIAAFLELGIKIDGVSGTSIGAINGAIIACGNAHILPSLWRSLSIGRVFGFSEEFVNAVNEKTLNLDFFKLTLAGILSVLSNKGIALEGLKELIDKYVDVDKLLASNMDFGLCTVRLKDLKPMYLFKEDMQKSRIRDYLLASAFLPIFRREKLIDENYYLDGGFYDISPVNMLIKKGYKTIYVVKIHGIGFHQAITEEANVIVIESKRNLGKVLDFDPKRVDENIKMGYYDALRVLKGYDGEKYVFKSKSDKFYQRFNKRVSKKLYRRVRSFFRGKSRKETTIRALEYVMEQVGINYYKIYDISKMVKYINKNYERNYFIYDYVKKLGRW